MILKHFEDLRTELEAKIRSHPERTNAREKYVLEIARLGVRLFTPGSRIAWAALITPYEILNAMGITAAYVEFVSGFLSGRNAVGRLITRAEEEGYPVDACGYHKAINGAMLDEIWPAPEFVVAASSPCIGGLAVLEGMARRFQRDLLVLDVPQEESADSVQYVAEQIERMVGFISDHSGVCLEREALRKAVTNSNTARRSKLELYSLVKASPSPANPHILRDFGYLAPVFDGTTVAIDVCDGFHREFRAAMRAGSSGVPGEAVRLLWIQNRIQFRLPAERAVLSQFRANVFDDMNDVYWDAIDPDDPYPGFARRMIGYPLGFSAEKRIALLKRQIREFRIDGVINPCNWGCRQLMAMRGLISERLKEIDVPVLNLEVDCVDSRNVAEGQAHTRLEAFLEMLSEKKRRRVPV